MAIRKRKHRVRERCCHRCFAYIRADSRKCEFCGYTYKSPTQYWADKLRRALHIDRAFAVGKEKTDGDASKFFTRAEIEELTRLNNFQILMFMSLDDITMLDEMALIELGETLMSMNKH